MAKWSYVNQVGQQKTVAASQLNFTGAYAALSAYALHDVVDYSAAQYVALDNVTGQTPLVEDTFAGDGTTKDFTLSTAPALESTAVVVDGVGRDEGQHYKMSGSTLTFFTAPTDGSAIVVDYVDYFWSVAVEVPGPSTSTSLAMASSTNPGTSGVLLTLTATVTAVTGTATGTVVFMRGATTIGTAALVAGVATLNLSFSTGIYNLTATYVPDTTDFEASSGSMTLSVAPAPAATLGFANEKFTAATGGTETFNLANVAIVGSIVVFRNGILQERDGDYSMSVDNDAITFITSIDIADRIVVNYAYSS